MRKNKEVRKVVNENFKPIKGKLMLYTLVFFLIPVAVSFIPFVGQLLSSIISAVCAIGFTAVVVNIYNGHGENESPVSFFSHSAKLFTNWFCAGLWICLKCIVGIIIAVIGLVMMMVGGASALVLSSQSSLDISQEMLGGLGIVAIIGLLLYFVGLIVTIILELKYNCVAYDVVHDNKSGKRAKEIVEEAKAHLKGHVWQWLCMGIYYGIFLFLIFFIISFVSGVAVTVLGNVVDASAATTILAIVVGILEYVVMLYFMPKMICAYEELHKDLA